MMSDWVVTATEAWGDIFLCYTLEVQVGPHQHKINLIACADVISLSTFVYY